MKWILTFAALAIVSASATAEDRYVAPHFRRDGTFVDGHMRSTPNSTRYDNLNSQNNIYGGVNPYSGQRGHQRDEFSDPPAYNKRQRNCVRDYVGNILCN